MSRRGTRTRREFLGEVGTAAARGLAVGLLPFGPSACSGDPRARALVGIFSDPQSARAVGRAFLEQRPEEADVAQLLDRLPESADRVRARHREDCAAGRTLELRGFVLSETEARLYALAALL